MPSRLNVCRQRWTIVRAHVWKGGRFETGTMECGLMKNPRSRPRASTRTSPSRRAFSASYRMRASRKRSPRRVERGAPPRAQTHRERAGGNDRGQPPNQLENERKTTLVRMQQAEIEVAGAKAKSEMHKLGKDRLTEIDDALFNILLDR